MYVTRPLSMYKKYPSALSLPPPEGPNTGILVIQDEAAEPRHFFGLFKGHELKHLPFPQNKDLKLRYSYRTGTGTGTGQHSTRHVSHFYAAFIPVLNQPLSSNRYFLIQSHGSHIGEAYTNSTLDDLETCCFCNFVREVDPKPLHPQNIYQQFEIRREGRLTQIGGFVAKSIAPDGFPPKFLARKGWEAYTSTPKDFHLDEEAPGLDTTLRSRLPEFNFPLASTSSRPVVVGKWYCPFMFIKDGTPRDQMGRSMYYKMTLEQRWEKIYSFEREFSEGNGSLVDVDVDVEVEGEVVMVGGREVGNVERDGANGVVWYRSFGKVGGDEVCVGLSLAIVEKMEWEERNVGWVRGRNERKVRVKKVEEIVNGENVRRFGCYVLVERFVLRRLDGSLVFTHDFRHTHQIRSKWE